MARDEPEAKLDERFSSEGAAATEWAAARRRLEEAELFWISTVRPDGRPHVTPLISVWLDDTLYFCTGPTEQKAKNLELNPHCILMTGCNALDDGLDIVVEGEAVRVTDNGRLRDLAAAWESKYGRDWRFAVEDDAFRHEHGDGSALVFEVAPAKVLGFGKGDTFSQTRWRFTRS